MPRIFNRATTYHGIDQQPEAGQGDRGQLHLHQARLGLQVVQLSQHHHGPVLPDPHQGGGPNCELVQLFLVCLHPGPA